MKRQPWAALIALALVATACSVDSTTVAEPLVDATAPAPTEPPVVDAVEPTAVPEPTEVPAPTATPVPEPTAAPTVTPAPTAVPEPTAVAAPTLVGAENLGAFAPGDCFNEVPVVPTGVQPSVPIDCQGEHEYEVFFVGQIDDGPDVPYRTGQLLDDLTEQLFADSCDPATIEFAGAPWDVLPFSTTVWTPSEADWFEGDRTFLCTAEAALRDQNIYKVGTAAGGTLRTDEGIVSRVSVSGTRDLYFSFQHSTIYPITSGLYDVPNVSPVVLPTAILFTAAFDGSDPFEYSFETGEVTSLDSGLEGWEVASLHLVPEVPAFVYAARETVNDDWDIYAWTGEGDPVALTDDPVDDLWPTLTPDSTRILYQSAGVIWIMNLDGSNKQELTNGVSSDFEMAVSPDGSTVLFASDRSGNDDIWAMNIDGSDVRNLTNHPGNEAWPFFSADGTQFYFQTDRLGVNSTMMIANIDGSNASHYSFEFMTNGALLPDEITQRFANELPTLSEAQAAAVDGVVPGAVGETNAIGHSSERIVAMLPAGWEYAEIEGDEAVLLGAASISDFNATWAADGAWITVVDVSLRDAFEARLDALPAAAGCDEVDRVDEIEEDQLTFERRYACGSGATAIVVGLFNPNAGAGLTFEGQWDGQPGDAEDEAVVRAILDQITWG